jgi:hypothetical protein
MNGILLQKRQPSGQRTPGNTLTAFQLPDMSLLQGITVKLSTGEIKRVLAGQKGTQQDFPGGRKIEETRRSL